MNADELACMFDRLGELAASEIAERLEPIELSRMLDRVDPHGASWLSLNLGTAAPASTVVVTTITDVAGIFLLLGMPP